VLSPAVTEGRPGDLSESKVLGMSPTLFGPYTASILSGSTIIIQINHFNIDPSGSGLE
jgi:hypothetical protein